jgi:organic radical activating enzyme
MGNLVVSEKFYSIQGEGQTMGIPAVFLRLAGCNILCKGKGWICDSIEVWKKGTKESFEEVLRGEYFERLKEGAHLVITGGEPMLHQKKLKEFLMWFKESYGWLPIIEIETNGTILPDEYFFTVVDYWNCSPKLSTSGETKIRRFNEVSLDRLNKSTKTIFKFVISNENDVLEVLNEYGNTIDMKKVVLMPAGDSQNLLNKTREIVLEQCIKLGLRYSDRLHIVGWNQKTGV